MKAITNPRKVGNGQFFIRITVGKGGPWIRIIRCNGKTFKSKQTGIKETDSDQIACVNATTRDPNRNQYLANLGVTPYASGGHNHSLLFPFSNKLLLKLKALNNLGVWPFVAFMKQSAPTAKFVAYGYFGRYAGEYDVSFDD